MARILIGKGTTNAQGIATMTEDAEGNTITGYTGVGAGLIDVQAEVSIDGSTFQSTPYEVVDGIFFDEATSNAKASQYNFSSQITASYDADTGTTLTCDETSGNYWAFTKIGDITTWRDTNKDYCIEFDCIYTSNAAQIYFGGQTVGIYRLNNNATSGTGKVKIITDGTTLTPYWNDVAVTSQEKTMTSQAGFQIGIYRSGNITFKNLKIYTI